MRAVIFLPLSVVAAGVVLCGCPAPLECENQNACPIGQVCNKDGKCVDAPPPPPGFDAGPIGEGEGEGEGEGDVQETVQTDAPVTMLIEDDANPGQALVGLANVAGGLDEAVRLDLSSGVLDGAVAFDFISLPGGQCAIDTITEVSAAKVGGAGNLPDGLDERWFSCQSRVDIEYDDDFANSFNSNIGSAEIVHFLVPSVLDNAGPNARIVVAKRGAAQLKILQLDPAFDQVNRDFGTEPFSDGTTFTHVEQVFTLASGDPTFGDILLVFDRAATPRLVPIQREPEAVTWHGPPLFQADPRIDILDLPVDTHAVIFREDVPIDLAALSFADADRDVTNLVALRPSADSNRGLVTFARYEVELTESTGGNFGDASAFQDLFLNASDPTVLPPTADRILLQTQAQGASVLAFYALTQSDHAWQFPLRADRNDGDTNSVARVQFIRQIDDHPNGMVLFPGDVNRAWFSFDDPTVNELNLLAFDQNFE